MSDQATILVPLADGFEEIEAVTIIDVLRRAGLPVVVAGLEPGPVTGSHGIALLPDTDLDGVDRSAVGAICLPGGMPGTTSLMSDTRVLAWVRELSEAEMPTTAICAAPLVLAAAGVLDGVEVTSHLSVREKLGAAVVLDRPRVVRSGHIVTSQGPGTALEFALELVRERCGEDKARELADAMLVASPGERPRRMNLFEEILRMQGAGRPCALCTIVRTAGSTPGKEMMKMLVRDDGSFAGTVGGGCLEAEVLEAALESMRDERARTLEFSLNERDYPDSGLICGGKVEIFVEPITEPKVYVFGGGHISGAIARIARLAGFHVTVGDDREAFASAERHPDAHERICAEYVDQAKALAPAHGAFLVVVTRGHKDDGDILHALYENDCRPRYLGMIGSRAKRATLFAELRAKGVSEEFLEGVQSPMGVAIGARTHEEIAVSVVAELIRVRRLVG